MIQEVLSSIDLTSFVGVAAASFALVEVVKRAFTKNVSTTNPDGSVAVEAKSPLDGKEGLISLGVSVVLGLLSWKFMGAFPGASAVGVGVSSLLASVLAQQIHDKVLMPLSGQPAK